MAFNLYRGGTKVNASPITGATTYLDSGAAAGSAYTVRAVVNGAEQAASAPALQFANGYLDVPIQPPPGGTTPSGEGYSYSANDASVGDLDGDGRYEFVLKWDPSNAKDNSQSGYTGNVYVDAYTLTGCGASTWAATSAPAPTTPSSRCTTTTATGTPRWP